MIWLGGFMMLIASLANNPQILGVGFFIAMVGVILEIR